MGVASAVVGPAVRIPVGRLAAAPPPPAGRRVELEGRGTTFVREVAGPPGAPTLLLLHGWVASAGLNWVHAFERLSRRFRVLAIDQRGHARGLRSSRRFRLEDCADDAAALLEKVDAGPTIAVGYSMGGPVAQLLWRRHRDKIAGLVMCATSAAPVGSNLTRGVLGALCTGASALASLVERDVRAAQRRTTNARRPRTLGAWAAEEFARHDPSALLEAGQALAGYDARSWVGGVDVPTSVVVTERDRGVSPDHQRKLARAIPGATVHRFDGGHTGCARPEFGPILDRACRSVANRLA